MANPPTLSSLSQSLTSHPLSLPTPHPSFLTKILTPTSQTKPLTVLTATAKHRLLSADISLPSILANNTTSFPQTTSNIRTISSVLPFDIFVQILDIEDIGSSKWDQIEKLESERKGETTKGREVIRVLPTPVGEGENDRGSTAATQQIQTPAQGMRSMSMGPHKVLLQDVKGMKIWGFEFKKVPGIGIGNGGSAIGCKVWLRKGCRVARGMVLLEPGMCTVVGGKIEGLDKVWREGREQRLREEVARDRPGGGH